MLVFLGIEGALAYLLGWILGADAGERLVCALIPAMVFCLLCL